MAIIFKHRTGKPNQHLYSTMFHWSVRLHCVDCGIEETTPMFCSEDGLEEMAQNHRCKTCKKEFIDAQSILALSSRPNDEKR
jgi:hypothetical protein